MSVGARHALRHVLRLANPARLAAPSQIAVDSTCAVAALAFFKPSSGDSLCLIVSLMRSQTVFRIAGWLAALLAARRQQTCSGVRSSIAGAASTAAQFAFNGASREADAFGNQFITQPGLIWCSIWTGCVSVRGGITVSPFVLADKGYRVCCSSPFLF